MFAFDAPRRPRRPGLTPMIDVVFLLLVFFMLAARFGQDAGLDLTLGGGVQAYDGPPRLVEVTPSDLRLNGVSQTGAALVAALRPLMAAPSDIVVIRARDGASLQRVVDTMTLLNGAGLTGLALVE